MATEAKLIHNMLFPEKVISLPHAGNLRFQKDGTMLFGTS